MNKTYRIIRRQDGQTLQKGLTAKQLREVTTIYPSTKYIYTTDSKWGV